MKKSLLYIIIVSVLFTSCSKFLQEDPKHLVTIENYYQTEADAVSAVNSIYAYLNSISTGSTAGVYHSTFWVMAGLASDELLNQQFFSPQYDQFATFTYTPFNSGLEEVWDRHYKTITLANIAIERIPKINMNPALRDRLVGEARFLRALMYFNLVRVFGEVPLLLNEVEDLYPSKVSTAAIYTAIENDLNLAKDVLPKNYVIGSGKGRATKGAAWALRAKMHLTKGEWKKASDACEEVFSLNEYALWDDFGDVFKLANRNGKEAVFSVGFGDANGALIFWEAGQFQVRLLPPALSVEGVVNAQGWQVPTLHLYNSYESGDRRREVTFISEVNNNGTIETIRPHIQKYWDRAAEPKGNESSNDFPVIRYADVLLTYAEANNELDNAGVAHDYINKIRKRARFNGVTELPVLADLSGLNKDQMREAILKERYLEFVAEGHRFFDLVRTGQLATKVPLAKPGVNPAPRHVYFPLPLRETDINPNLKQNDLYK
ncbi:RagB/SusD family nutrient uptake outer membrane protein [Gynurincola endophyticus]|uniref:RagB/SusD family nutrient uptake outer membrane protein n=1 Tax=Gynurincola endophyticus TaxID=2479004 RepID=UPI000F8C59DE|nr:RagB/SusD family nutrient uptake outer membrane protein [Gynurincola endophyticus]